tara:strand:- start:234 stop:452 length:219 start_codon:yes stop_codon:yes gene_type:complete
MNSSETSLSDLLNYLAELHEAIIKDGCVAPLSQIHIAMALKFVMEHSTPCYYSEQEHNLLEGVARMLEESIQ